MKEDDLLLPKNSLVVNKTIIIRRNTIRWVAIKRWTNTFRKIKNIFKKEKLKLPETLTQSKMLKHAATIINTGSNWETREGGAKTTALPKETSVFAHNANELLWNNRFYVAKERSQAPHLRVLKVSFYSCFNMQMQFGFVQRQKKNAFWKLLRQKRSGQLEKISNGYSSTATL